MRDDLDAERLAEQGLDDRTDRDPRRGLPRACAFQDRPGVGVAVLLHAGEVGVPRPGTGERRVAGDPHQDGRIDRVSRHDRLPLGPLGVAHADRHRAAQRDTVPQPAEDLHRVLLEAHPRAAAVPEPSARQLARHVGARQLHPGGDALQDRDERGSVRLSRGQPAQHG
jgi:hypothetical protein